MQNEALLERILEEVDDVNLKCRLIKHLFSSSAQSNTGVPVLRHRPLRLNNAEICARMKLVCGGTSSEVAKLLNVSQQAFSNQICRNAISPRSILDIHLKTGVSVDWILGSWDGSSDNYVATEFYAPSELRVSQPSKQFLSLVEIYDQQTGVEELKWSVTKYHGCQDDKGRQIPDDFGVLLSIICRYKNEAGTPDKVKRRVKRHFQVRRVIAYVVGDPRIIRSIDAKAKKLTLQYQSNLVKRTGHTEFRKFSAREECLQIFSGLATKAGVSVNTPQFNTIAWDLLIGAGGMDPKVWILERIKELRV